MIKKILKYTLILILFFTTNLVYAQENNNTKINITKVYQGSKELKLVDNKYIVDGYNTIYIEFELDNANMTDEYFLVGTSNNGEEINAYYGRYNKFNIFDIDPKNTSYDIKLCSDFNCSEVFDTTKIYFDYQLEENNPKLNVIKVKQAYQELESEVKYEKNTFTINGSRITYLDIKAENLIDNATYRIGKYYNEKTYTGKELMDGLTIEIYPDEYDNYLGNYNVIALFRERTILNEALYNDLPIAMELTNPSDNEHFEHNYSYANYNNISVNKVNEYTNTYVINKNYFTTNSPINIYVINPKAYHKGYPISIKIVKDGKIYVEKQLTINGSDMKEGYNITIDYPGGINYYRFFDEEDTYKVYINIDEYGYIDEFLYNSTGKNASISSSFYFDEGRFNLFTAKGTGTYYFSGGIYDFNKNLFNKYEYIYPFFMGDENFEDDYTYNYILEYGYSELDGTDRYDSVIASGEILGKKLKEEGIFFKVDNHNNYINPAYRFSVRKDDEIISAGRPVINSMEYNTSSNISLITNENLQYSVDRNYISNFQYTANRNAKIKGVVSGIGYEDDEEYEFGVYYFFYLDEEQNQKTESKEVKFNLLGKDINDGKAYFTIDEDIKPEYTELHIYAYGQRYGQGAADVKFVDKLPANDDLYNPIKRIAKLNNTSITGELDSKIIYYNDKVAKISGEDTDFDHHYNIFTIDINTLNINNNLKINYIGKKFKNDLNYEYIFIKDQNNNIDINNINEDDIIDQNSISGYDLNNYGIIKEITIKDISMDNKKENYLLIIKYDNEIIYVNKTHMYLLGNPMINSVILTSDNANLFNNGYTYTIDSKYKPIVNLVGSNFNKDEEFSFTIIEEKKNKDCNEETCIVNIDKDKITYTGEEINNGISYTLNENTNSSVIINDITIHIKDKNNSIIETYRLRIKYINTLNYFEENNTYQVDSEKDLVKNISKKTTREEFIKNINVKEDTKIKLYDSMGHEKITGNVGTGMFLRILDKDLNDITEIPIVVTGDVSGDGNISILDVINIERHIANLNKLSGAYEVAGDVTNSGKVAILDLIKIVRDVAKIEEIK